MIKASCFYCMLLKRAVYFDGDDNLGCGYHGILEMKRAGLNGFRSSYQDLTKSAISSK